MSGTGELDNMPHVDSFFGLDLKTGAIIIAVLGMVHPMAYGCTFFMRLSYMLVTIWILVALYFAASIALFYGILKGSSVLLVIWLWYTIVFVAIMLLMMLVFALLFTSRTQRNRVLAVLCGMLWYILTIYFIFVVNSYRKSLHATAKVVTPGKESLRMIKGLYEVNMNK